MFNNAAPEERRSRFLTVNKPQLSWASLIADGCGIVADWTVDWCTNAR